jgi:aspartyl-tRNA(Asn)/glutamyl-tRNA(Gln) amidotransferase subunit A
MTTHAPTAAPGCAETQYRRRTAFNEAFRCFVTVLPPGPRRPGGPLAGLTTGVKDCIDIGSVRGTWGSALFADRVAPKDAFVVELLRRAGAEFVATTNLHEFAFGGTTQNPHFGFCRNAWNPDRVSGGSSGGSAVAVALGLCDLGVGTDTGASIRLPAALNGVFGLRPTHGAVSSAGVMPVSPPHDTVGFIARDLATLRRAVACTYRYDRDDPFSGRTRAGRRRRAAATVGVLAELTAASDPDVRAAFDLTLARLAGQRVPVRNVSCRDFVDVAAALSAVVIADAASFHRARLTQSPEAIGTLVRERIAAGLAMSATDYAASLRWLERFRSTVHRLFDEFDFLACPTVPVTPPKIDDLQDGAAATRALTGNCWAAPAAGLPALTIPAGVDRNGIPTGFQLIGPQHADIALLEFAAEHLAIEVPVVDRDAFARWGNP